MRFVLDEDTPVSIRSFLVARGHECWTATQAGLSGGKDDPLSTYAQDKGAVLISHDEELADRRKKRTFGPHIWLNCHQTRALEVLSIHIESIERLVGREMRPCVLEIGPKQLVFHPPDWQA